MNITLRHLSLTIIFVAACSSETVPAVPIIDVGTQDLATDEGREDSGNIDTEVDANVELRTFEISRFNAERIAFGEGFDQTVSQVFEFDTRPRFVDKITMIVKLTCPTDGCNIWDVFANIKVTDPDSGARWELGRFITPYGVDTSQTERGIEIDVTDFRSVLTGAVELTARIETWGADGWLIDVSFEVEEAMLELPFSKVFPLLNFDEWSTSGVPYGVAHEFDVTNTIAIPSAAQSAHLRTTISGWGHATPTDDDGRPCAEWCYRTHHILLNGVRRFAHKLEPIGCAANPIQPQRGNWEPDRAGWCPGMAVPTRIDPLETSPRDLSFEYEFEPWTSDGGTTAQQEGSFYAISSFLVVESSQPLD